MSGKDKIIKCKKCTLLAELYKSAPKTNRNYYIMTELFVLLHGSDTCHVNPKVSITDGKEKGEINVPSA